MRSDYKIDRSVPADVLEREKHRLSNALAVLRNLCLGNGQLPDTHERVTRAIAEIEMAEINAETVWIRRVNAELKF